MKNVVTFKFLSTKRCSNDFHITQVTLKHLLQKLETQNASITKFLLIVTDLKAL